MAKLNIDYNMAAVQLDNVHGYHEKDQIILHETISPNYLGLGDIRANSEYLDNKDFGIHGITDAEGHIAWALGLGKAVFYHTKSDGEKGSGNANSRGIGIEQVSRVPLDYRLNAKRRQVWLGMQLELEATAKLCACIRRAHPKCLLRTSDGTQSGITTHWQVTNAYGVPGGHTDCWPVNDGGYFPLSWVIQRAKYHYLRGVSF